MAYFERRANGLKSKRDEDGDDMGSRTRRASKKLTSWRKAMSQIQ
jgi:hypothetical protein